MFTLVTQDNVENFSINININSPAIHSFDCSKLNGFLLIFLIPERIKTFTYYSIVKELAQKLERTDLVNSCLPYIQYLSASEMAYYV